ncbi:hypothetical protein Dda_4928 [Drechslerella dactyloides]|uniref:Uncharacterized protein n=1 Tax=Drechslerella dactyloides TaxID=74499 RepID=A0AAD6IXT8_DREDA|nr:hypothetical protein Dda_4928 [Drechslerella dactyloides]
MGMIMKVKMLTNDKVSGSPLNPEEEGEGDDEMMRKARRSSRRTSRGASRMEPSRASEIGTKRKR